MEHIEKQMPTEEEEVDEDLYSDAELLQMAREIDPSIGDDFMTDEERIMNTFLGSLKIIQDIQYFTSTNIKQYNTMKGGRGI